MAWRIPLYLPIPALSLERPLLTRFLAYLETVMEERPLVLLYLLLRMNDLRPLYPPIAHAMPLLPHWVVNLPSGLYGRWIGITT